jgi:hypothetical protein
VYALMTLKVRPSPMSLEQRMLTNRDCLFGADRRALARGEYSRGEYSRGEVHCRAQRKRHARARYHPPSDMTANETPSACSAGGSDRSSSFTPILDSSAYAGLLKGGRVKPRTHRTRTRFASELSREPAAIDRHARAGTRVTRSATVKQGALQVPKNFGLIERSAACDRNTSLTTFVAS